MSSVALREAHNLETAVQFCHPLLLAPTTEQLGAIIPVEIWDLAIKQASRSDHKRHRTGCVIFHRDKILSRGCSHTHNGGMKIRSIHAEMDAIKNCPPSETKSIYYRAVIVTLTRVGNFASISKPCTGCAHLLSTRVITVTYAERNNDGSWRIETRTPYELLDDQLSSTRYALA